MSEQPPTAKPVSRSRWPRVVLVLLAISGCAISGVLVWMSSPAQTDGALLGTSLCEPGERVDCHYVLGSRWARVAGVPTAILGLTYFTVLAFWFAAVGIPNRAGRHWHFVPLALTTLGVCASLWFTYVMATKLPVWCTWCIAAHAVSGLTWLSTLLTWPRKAADRGGRPYPSNTRAGIVAGSSAAAVVILFLTGLAIVQAVSVRRLSQKYLEVTSDVDYIAWRHSRSPVHDIPVRPDDPAIGDTDAPNTLVVFSDFECPKCAALHHNVASLVSQFSGTLRCVFKHYPMSAKCNPNIEREVHYYACEAALAAEAARATGTQEQRREYDRLLYENRSRFDEKPYRRLAGQAGIDAESFSITMSSEMARQRVQDDLTLGKQLGVEGTPYLFLNGRRLVNWRILTLTNRRRPETDIQQTLVLWEQLLGTQAVINREDNVGGNENGVSR